MTLMLEQFKHNSEGHGLLKYLYDFVNVSN
jgi:hypothetical protein